MTQTAHSEYGKLHSLFLKRASDAFINNNHLEKEWQLLNYTGKPDFEDAVSEYSKFESLLKKTGASLFYLPQSDHVNMDSIYCRDAAIATNEGMIICNMGKAARNNEPKEEEKAFTENLIPILGAIKSPGTVEGGDVAWLDEQTLAVGHSYRTNEEGIAQLRALLRPLDAEVVVVPLPHYKGTGDVFHLMSILSPIDKNLAVVYSPLMPIVFRNYLLKKGYELVEVPDEEFETMGCNVLALSSRECLLVSGNHKTKSLLQRAGCNVIEYNGNEISVKGGGGPTCLTRPVWREV
jgi:N-dimethylarginine dimethylaminohydrolase